MVNRLTGRSAIDRRRKEVREQIDVFPGHLLLAFLPDLQHHHVRRRETPIDAGSIRSEDLLELCPDRFIEGLEGLDRLLFDRGDDVPVLEIGLLAPPAADHVRDQETRLRTPAAPVFLEVRLQSLLQFVDRIEEDPLRPAHRFDAHASLGAPAPDRKLHRGSAGRRRQELPSGLPHRGDRLPPDGQEQLAGTEPRL
jgi:hypothetical protein